ncbi:voltage-gated potassium channel [Methanohalophilus euhalobius]|uniref:Potassium channel protein n=1 Tax=Methanohalophilus euhalobius TaxID=51203 RepID=A0A314ZPY5_9EURY|nr:voltage-gated potassium channel [Methanohalophilus euhalobius]RNI09277.1 potassium channel protein [Methanohalophilus euhalobius]
MVLWPLRKIKKSILGLVKGKEYREREVAAVFLVSAIAQILILYMIDGKTLNEAIYGTVATLTTVGFGDVAPSSSLARYLYIPFMVTGVLMLPTAAVLVYDIHRKKVRGLSRSKQQNHVVVLGDSNEIIKSIVMEMDKKYEICLVSELYETNPFKERVHFVKGDPLEKEVLRNSNIETASHAIIATENDSTTILATAMVRELNPDANIIATIVSEEKVETIKTIGANHVINTDSVTGRLLASGVHEPNVVDLISDITSSLEGHDVIEVNFPAELHGKTIEDAVMHLRVNRGMTLLALNRNGKNIVNPPLENIIEKGDKMVVLANSGKTN